jgi:LCP family protein required for cell wall assembly
LSSRQDRGHRRPIRWWILAATLVGALVIAGLAAYEAFGLATAWNSIERVSLDSDVDAPGPTAEAAPTPTTASTERSSETVSKEDPHPQTSTVAEEPEQPFNLPPSTSSSTTPSSPSTPSTTSTSTSTTTAGTPDVAGSETSGSVDTTEATQSTLEEVPSPPEAMLLVGSDSRSGIEDLDDFGSFAGQRADVIILAIREGDDVTLLSVPRDLYVQDSCAGGRHRINAAFAGCGDRHGLAVLATELEGLTGLPVEHALAVDLAGFPAVVDELGGYEICTEYPLRDLKSGLELGEGCTFADGDTVLQWLRSRYTERRVDVAWEYVPGVSDLTRNERQRSFLLSMFDRLTRTSGLGEIRRVVQSVAPHLTIDDELAIRDLASWLWDFRGAEVEAESIPVAAETTTGGASVLVPTVDVEEFTASLNS